MEKDKKYLVIDYKKNRKHQIHLLEYIIKCGSFGKGYVYSKDIKVYNNLYHFIKYESKNIQLKELEQGFSIFENVTEDFILKDFDNTVSW